MYKDIITYQLAKDVTKEQLLNISQEIITNWMSKQPGFISREINQQENGSYTDIVARESKESAKNAQQEMMNIPNAAQRYACYEKDSNICINCEQVAMYTA